MRRSTHLAWGLLVLGVVACSDTDKSTPTAPSFRPSPPPANTCNFQTLANLAGDEFNTPQKQTAQGLINSMQGGGANTSTAESFGLDLLKLEAVTIDAGLQRGTAQTGANFANNVIYCFTSQSKQGVILPIGPDPFDPTKDGAAAVRGGTSNAGVADPVDPVVTRLGGSALGLDPSVTNNTWALTLGGRTFIYAQKNTTALVGGLIGAAYDWNTVPKRTTLPNRTLVLGICQQDAKSLLQENSAIVQFQSVAFLEALTGRKLCPTTVGTEGGSWRDPFGLARRLFTPTPAFAAVVNPGGTGGKIGGFSTFYVVDAGSIVLTITQQPTDGLINKPITVKVRANANVTDQNGTNTAPIEGVIVTATVAGNSGSFNLAPPIPTDTTDTAGEATLTFQIDKPGGYTVTVSTQNLVNSTTPLQSYPPVSVTTNLFNLQQHH